MNTALVLYKPAHPDAPKFKKRTKGVSINIHTKKPESKRKYSDIVHNRFRSSHVQCNLKNSELTHILEVFNQNVLQATLENRSGVLFPNRMGKIQVVSVKQKDKQRVDAKTSKELGYEVHENKNKNGGIYPLTIVDVYGDSFNMPNKYLWEFKASVGFKKELQDAIKKDRTRFTPVKKEYIAYYRKDKFHKKEFAKEKEAELLLTYNEFEGII